MKWNPTIQPLSNIKYHISNVQMNNGSKRESTKLILWNIYEKYMHLKCKCSMFEFLLPGRIYVWMLNTKLNICLNCYYQREHEIAVYSKSVALQWLENEDYHADYHHPNRLHHLHHHDHHDHLDHLDHHQHPHHLNHHNQFWRICNKKH